MTPLLLAVALAASPQSSLDAAKHRWHRFHASSYTYVVTKTCGRCLTEPVRVRVRNGKPVGTPRGMLGYDTVPELFDRIQDAIDSHPYRVDATYGPRSGVPTMVAVDEDRDMVDDVTGFVVERFRRG